VAVLEIFGETPRRTPGRAWPLGRRRPRSVHPDSARTRGVFGSRTWDACARPYRANA
jgi:hypothetical protein